MMSTLGARTVGFPPPFGLFSLEFERMFEFSAYWSLVLCPLRGSSVCLVTFKTFGEERRVARADTCGEIGEAEMGLRRTGTGALAGAAGLALLAGRALRRARAIDLHGRVAVVTGGSRGLGLLIARELARAGCRLSIGALDEARLARAREDLERVGGAEVLTVGCDVADRARAEALIERTVTRFGRIDVLVNNAGVVQVGPVRTMTAADFERAVGVMLLGTVYPTLAALPHMLARRDGRIVNITSVGGKLSVPHLLPYSTAKFGTVGFSEGLRAELARHRVLVTTVVPGLLRTGSHLNAEFRGDQRREFAWFGVAANLPLLSMDAERAAARIVDAARRGQAELILTPPAHLATRVQGLLPGTMTNLLSVADRLLPGGTGAAPGRRGVELLEERPAPLLERLMGLGTAAARRSHQLPGPAPRG
jgi:NAD(P)-dependent dehydrogenase (short-subunit alcohol dehydrogenase family)